MANDILTVQRALAQVAQAANPAGGLADEMDLALTRLHKYAYSITHVLTGRLRNSLFTDTEQQGNDLLGHVATNVDYSIHEHNRGGDHAFFERTVKERGPSTANDLIGGFIVRAGVA